MKWRTFVVYLEKCLSKEMKWQPSGSSEYEEEQSRVRQMLEMEGVSTGKEHLLEFLEEWERLQGN